MRAVADPDAAGRDPFARRTAGRMADHGHKITLASRVDLQDSKAILGVVEGDAFDRAREGL